MSGASRKTHVVRVRSGDPDNETYVDIEVLDAISFKTTNGKEMILSLPAKQAVPYIVDDTGAGNEKKPGRATRRSHMEHVTGNEKTGFFDAEVIDMISFNDQNGEEWILDMSEPQGRTHSEEVNNKEDPTEGLIIERSDMMAFRTTNGKEMIINMASCDDGSTARADTDMTPPDYDPNGGSAPPDNDDPHFYVTFMKKTSTSPPITTLNTIYFVWNDVAPFPTKENFGNSISTLERISYHQQFARIVDINAGGAWATVARVTGYSGNGTFGTFAEAQDYATKFNDALRPPPTHEFTGYWPAGGGFVDLGFIGATANVYVGSLTFTHTEPGSTKTKWIAPFGGTVKQGPLWWIRKVYRQKSKPPGNAG